MNKLLEIGWIAAQDYSFTTQENCYTDPDRLPAFIAIDATISVGAIHELPLLK